MMTRKLTLAQKKKIMKYLIDRDGFQCYLCGQEFKGLREPIIEHINDDPKDNREDNLALAHQSCNIRKIKDKEYCNIAEAKLEENELHMYVGESFLEEKSQKEASTEIEISNKCFDITEKFLFDNILQKGWIDYKQTLHSIVYICRKTVGHGSQQQIRSHIQTLTSEVAPFMMDKEPNTKKKIIRKRT